MNLGVFLPLQLSEIVWEGLIVLIYMFGRILQWCCPVLDFYLQGGLLFAFWFNCRFCFTSGDWSVQILSSGSSLSRRYIFKFFPFFLDCQVWHITVHSILLFFCISVVLDFIFPMSFPILFESSLFSAWWASIKIYYFCFSFQKASSFINFFLLFISV